MAQKTPKPLWFRGFSNRYLFRFAMLGRGAEKDAMIIRIQMFAFALRKQIEIRIYYKTPLNSHQK